MTHLALPPDYPRIKLVSSFHELITTPFAEGINALCWPRTLPGDFREIIQHLTISPGITNLDDALLLSLPLSPAGRTAIEVLLEDQRLLREHGLDPVLNCIDGYSTMLV